MGTIREIEWGACLLEQTPHPELEQRFRRETGRPGDIMRFFGDCAWLSDTIIRVSVQLNTHRYIEPNLVDQAGLVVSQDNSCRFCFGMQRAFLRVLGVSERRIALLEQDLLTGEFNPRERAALDFARRLSQSNPPISNTEVQALREQGFADVEIAEFAGLIALHLFFNRVSTFSALPPQRMEQFPDRWWVRFARPLLAMTFRRMRHRARPTTLTESERTGPFSAIVNALDGLPLARELRIVLDGMWESPALAPRTVSLIFAVVARALGSESGEREAAILLLDQGLERDDIHQVLTHLASPALSDVERVLVPFARETVRYQPAHIQRRCSEVRRHLTEEQFLKLLGVVSLANAICRLGFLTGIGK